MITKGDIYNLNIELTEIETKLKTLDPNHWYENKQLELLYKRLDEIDLILKPMLRLVWDTE